MTAEEYGLMVHDACELTPVMNDGAASLKQLLFDVLSVLHVTEETQEKALPLFKEFNDRYPDWAVETVRGLPLSILPLDILVQSGVLADTEKLPHPGDVVVAGLLSDVGKVALENIYPEVIEASYHRPELWNQEMAKKMRPHVYLGMMMAEHVGLSRSVQMGIGTHHIYAPNPYGPKSNLSGQDMLTAVLLANEDYAMAAATRSDTATPKGGEQEIRDMITENSLRLFRHFTSSLVASEIAEQTADFAINAAVELGRDTVRKV